MLLYTDSFKKELLLRWSKIQRKLKELDVEACLISTNVNSWYAVGQIIIG